MSTATMSRDIMSIDIMSHCTKKGAYVARVLGRILIGKSIQMSLTSHCIEKVLMSHWYRLVSLTRKEDQPNDKHFSPYMMMLLQGHKARILVIALTLGS